MGWSGFAKSSWAWLDDLYQDAMDKQQAVTNTLDVGGWEYEITIDPQMNDEAHPEACGFQVTSKRKKRLIKRDPEAGMLMITA